MLSKLRYILVCMVCLPGVVARAATINVGPGQTCTTIQCGINAANAGDTVLVAPGTYYENIDFMGKAITVTSSGGAASTIIDAGGKGTVVFLGAASSVSILDGFTIQHGDPGTNYMYGGGVVVVGTATVRNNTVTAIRSCGVHILTAPKVLIQNNHIYGNVEGDSADCGSNPYGIYDNDEDGATIVGNTIEQNYSGGILTPDNYAYPTVISNNLIRNNGTTDVPFLSAGLVLNGLNVVTGNLIYGNLGVGIFFSDDSVVTLVNNTIYRNNLANTLAYVKATEVDMGEANTWYVANNIIVGTSASMAPLACYAQPLGNPYTADNNDVYDTATNSGGLPATCTTGVALNGNIGVDPMFKNAAGDDFHLIAGSAAIDAGLNTANDLTATDLDGNPRIQDANQTSCAIVDMGAYEYPGTLVGCAPTMSLQSSVNPSTIGQNVTLTAQLSSTMGVPTGSVQFTDGPTVLSTQTVSGAGASSFSTAALAVGGHPITAAYAPTGLFTATSASLTQVVNGYATTTNLSCSPGTIYVDSGQRALLQASVISANGTPAGSVVFADNGALLTTVGLSGGVAIDYYSGTVVGTHTVTATYVPTSAFAGSSNSCQEQVVLEPSTTTIVSSVNPSNAGQSVTFTATVVLFLEPGQGIAGAGTLTFTDGSTTLGTVNLTSTGTVGTETGSYTTSAMAAGSHTIAATYNPRVGYAVSSASLTQVVNALQAAAVLVAVPVSETYGTPTVLTATVSAAPPPGNGVPSGAVSFSVDGVVVAAQQALSAGVASYTVPALTVGTHVVTCAYLGDASYAGVACNSVMVTVTAATTGLTITSSLNPAYALQTVTFTVHMTINGVAAGAGNAIVWDASGGGGSMILLYTDATGTATIRAGFLPGSYMQTADFVATTNLLASHAALTEVVVSNGTSTTLMSSLNPAYQGQSVMLTAAVTDTNGVTPVGTVSFEDAGAVIGTGTLDATGAASMVTSTLTVGTHPLTAVYVPGASLLGPTSGVGFTGSSSNTVQEQILSSTFTIALAPASIALPPGQTGHVGILLGSVGNFSGPLALTYGALPTYATASIAPSTVTLAVGGTGNSTLTLNTLMKAQNERPFGGGRVVWALILVGMPLVLRRRRVILLVVMGLVAMQGMVGCTNTWYTASPVAPGTYSVAVTATDVNGNAKTAVLSVVVTQ